jgi:hypothetical protein
MRWVVVLSVLPSVLFLGGCAGSFSFGRQAPPLVVPAGDKVTETPDGGVIAEPITPSLSPIETTIIGMAQAQQLRTLVRQLSR